MSTKSETSKVLEDALRLDSGSRALVAEALLESLDVEDDFSVSGQWMAEIVRRCADIDSGKAQLLASEHVINELRGKYTR